MGARLVPRLIKGKKCGGLDCGCCVPVCPKNCISFNRDGKVLFDIEKCSGCSACFKACFASQCIEMVEENG